MVSRIIARLLFMGVITTLAACEGTPASATAGEAVSGNTILSQQPDVELPAVFGGALDNTQYIGLAGVEPYYMQGPHAAVLAECVNAQSEDFSCSLDKLPFLALEGGTPSVAAIMQRLVVSHRWMGERFEEVLLHLPADALQLFSSVTAVVVAADVHPSYFSTMTGAVYLDPQLFWRTSSDKTLFELFADQTMVRSDDPLKFRSWSRYVDLNGVPLPDPTLQSVAQRTLQELLPAVAALLFHELAHANDFFPPAHLAQVPRHTTVFEAAALMKGLRASDELYTQFPLHNPPLSHFSRVLYQRQGMYTATELDWSAPEFGELFDATAANDDYAFVHQFEDMAMLFEESMMRFHFDLIRDVAFVVPPKNRQSDACDDYKIGWGIRGRLGRGDISMRAQWVVEAVLPNTDWRIHFAELGPPQLLPVGLGWCESGSDQILSANSTRGEV